MAHFAHLDPTNTVTEVIVVDNDNMIDPNTGQESEAVGITYIESVLGPDSGPWVQCSYNGNFRGCYPGIGYMWDPVLEVFYDPTPPPPPEPEP